MYTEIWVPDTDAELDGLFDCADDDCRKNYFIIQSHHDHCLPTEIPIEVEQDVHDFENALHQDLFLKE